MVRDCQGGADGGLSPGGGSGASRRLSRRTAQAAAVSLVWPPESRAWAIRTPLVLGVLQMKCWSWLGGENREQQFGVINELVFRLATGEGFAFAQNNRHSIAPLFHVKGAVHLTGRSGNRAFR